MVVDRGGRDSQKFRDVLELKPIRSVAGNQRFRDGDDLLAGHLPAAGLFGMFVGAHFGASLTFFGR
jgi:hypothetical protein